MTIPLRHFLVGLLFLLVGLALRMGTLLDSFGGFEAIAATHLLLVGWVCITIMGAMTQFVPVWAGTHLFSRKLASLQLVFVTAGIAGMGVGFVIQAFEILALAGGFVLLGFWVFAANIGATVATLDALDVTLRHFLIALGFLLAVPILGVILAVDLFSQILPMGGVTHSGILGAHATLAVFGIVLTTIYGALYQLGTMFTQTELHCADHLLQRFESVMHPAGVLVLATGRLFDVPWLGSVGGVAIALSALAVAGVIGRKLVEMQVEWTPMHRRYAVAMAALVTWAGMAIPAWITAPLDRTHLLGASGTASLLVLGVIGFVILGTLYHIIPFIIWVHEYSDQLGFEQVPMIDDLYADRLARVDLMTVAIGVAMLAVGEASGVEASLMTIPTGVILAGGLIFTTNMLLVISRHGPHSLSRVVFGRTVTNRFSPATMVQDND